MRPLLFFFFSLFIPNTVFSQSLTKITDFPSLERDDGTYFIIGNTAFCGTGFQAGFVLSKDMYTFDMASETWDTATTLPAGMERQYACGFALNNTGFILGELQEPHISMIYGCTMF